MTSVDWFPEITAKLVVFGSGGTGTSVVCVCVCVSFTGGSRALSLAAECLSVFSHPPVHNEEERPRLVGVHASLSYLKPLS